MEKSSPALALASEKAWEFASKADAVLRTGVSRAAPHVLAAKNKAWEGAHSIGTKLAQGNVGDIDRTEVTTILSVVLGLYFAYVFALVFYRLYLHPLAKFPGYKICAACEWYEFYCYIVKGGQWGTRSARCTRNMASNSPILREAHSSLLITIFVHQCLTANGFAGPIVRTSPWELSIRDPVFYDQLYVTAATRKTDMWPRGREGNGFDSITRIEPRIAELVMKMDKRIVGLKGSGAVVPVDHLLCALTGDVIGQVSSGMQAGLLDDPDFTPAW
ncbi:cytochrome P450 monooxygenase [Colletotrichum tofieldiae]|nr:cytochrome P450 monooxygenase [Colletotrichum tofieldiae]